MESSRYDVVVLPFVPVMAWVQSLSDGPAVELVRHDSERGPGVPDDDLEHARGTRGLLDESRDGAALRGLGDVEVTVGGQSADRHEQPPGLHPARVVLH